MVQRVSALRIEAGATMITFPPATTELEACSLDRKVYQRTGVEGFPENMVSTNAINFQNPERYVQKRRYVAMGLKFIFAFNVNPKVLWSEL